MKVWEVVYGCVYELDDRTAFDALMEFAMGRKLNHLDFPSPMLADAIYTCSHETTAQALTVGEDGWDREIEMGYGWYGFCPLCDDRLTELVRRAGDVWVPPSE